MMRLTTEYVRFITEMCLSNRRVYSCVGGTMSATGTGPAGDYVTIVNGEIHEEGELVVGKTKPEWALKAFISELLRFIGDSHTVYFRCLPVVDFQDGKYYIRTSVAAV